mmetsp:Transcript_36546/g.91925  ORF Transcript_36546/g.91925 Transcript_36546/m.91925 type:complete len:231 (+) Transcript_36546:1037-1729(+)
MLVGVPVPVAMRVRVSVTMIGLMIAVILTMTAVIVDGLLVGPFPPLRQLLGYPHSLPQVILIVSTRYPARSLRRAHHCVQRHLAPFAGQNMGGRVDGSYGCFQRQLLLLSLQQVSLVQNNIICALHLLDKQIHNLSLRIGLCLIPILIAKIRPVDDVLFGRVEGGKGGRIHHSHHRLKLSLLHHHMLSLKSLNKLPPDILWFGNSRQLNNDAIVSVSPSLRKPKQLQDAL